MDKISKTLEEALATISAQEQRIQMLQPDASTNVMWKHMNPEAKVKIKVSPKNKGNPLLQKDPEEEENTSQSSNHHRTSGILGPSYFGGRWTAHRADYKKVSVIEYRYA